MGLLPFDSEVDDNTLTALIKSREFNIIFIKAQSRKGQSNIQQFKNCIYDHTITIKT